MPSTYIGIDAILTRALAGAKAGVAVSLGDLEGVVSGEIPVDEGDLRDSLHTDAPRTSGRTVRGKISAGEGLDYAVIVHQRHPNHGTKFIQRPLLAHVPRHLATVAAAVRRAL